MQLQETIAAHLLDIQAVKLSPSKPYTWASGWQSPIYCDNRKALSFPIIREDIVKGLVQILQQHFKNIQLIAGVATAGIAWGALLSHQAGLPYCYVRPKSKEHGLGNQIEGYYTTGQKVVVIEDLISTGKSSLQVVDVLKQQGLQVEGMISIFNYGFDIAQQAFEHAALPLFSLSNYNTLVKVALEKEIISSSELNLLNRFTSNPEGWNK